MERRAFTVFTSDGDPPAEDFQLLFILTPAPSAGGSGTRQKYEPFAWEVFAFKAGGTEPAAHTAVWQSSRNMAYFDGDEVPRSSVPIYPGQYVELNGNLELATHSLRYGDDSKILAINNSDLDRRFVLGTEVEWDDGETEFYPYVLLQALSPKEGLMAQVPRYLQIYQMKHPRHRPIRHGELSQKRPLLVVGENTDSLDVSLMPPRSWWHVQSDRSGNLTLHSKDDSNRHTIYPIKALLKETILRSMKKDHPLVLQELGSNALGKSTDDWDVLPSGQYYHRIPWNTAHLSNDDELLLTGVSTKTSKLGQAGDPVVGQRASSSSSNDIEESPDPQLSATTDQVSGKIESETSQTVGDEESSETESETGGEDNEEEDRTSAISVHSVEAKSPGGLHSSHASTFYESGSEQSGSEDELIESARQEGNQARLTNHPVHNTDYVNPIKPIQKPKPNLAILDGKHIGGSDKSSEPSPDIVSPIHDLLPGGWIGGSGRGNHALGSSQQALSVTGEKIVGDREKNLPSWMPQVSTSIGKLFTSNTRHSTGQNGGSSGTQGSNFPVAAVSRLGLFRNNSGEPPPITHDDCHDTRIPGSDPNASLPPVGNDRASTFSQLRTYLKTPDVISAFRAGRTAIAESDSHTAQRVQGGDGPAGRSNKELSNTSTKGPRESVIGTKGSATHYAISRNSVAFPEPKSAGFQCPGALPWGGMASEGNDDPQSASPESPTGRIPETSSDTVGQIQSKSRSKASSTTTFVSLHGDGTHQTDELGELKLDSGDVRGNTSPIGEAYPTQNPLTPDDIAPPRTNPSLPSVDSEDAGNLNFENTEELERAPKSDLDPSISSNESITGISQSGSSQILIEATAPEVEAIDLMPLHDELLHAANLIKSQIPLGDVAWGKEVYRRFGAKVMPILRDFTANANTWDGYHGEGA